jgi:hypothetical protein
MSDAAHFMTGDLQLGASGDLLIADGTLESQQRILRRLLTNPQAYIWHPEYGAGLPSKIGQPLNQAEMNTLITSQMYREESVSQNPAPNIITDAIPNGLNVQIQYVEQESAQATVLSFEVTP